MILRGHRWGWIKAATLLLALAPVPSAAARQHAPPDEQRIVPEPPKRIQQAVPARSPAIMKLVLPASGMVWIESMQMSSTGPVRLFQSPPLEPSKAYVYKVKVSWPTQPGRPDFVMEQEVTVQAGLTTTVDFTPVVQAVVLPPQPPLRQAGHVQPAGYQPATPPQPPPAAPPANRVPTRRQVPHRGG